MQDSNSNSKKIIIAIVILCILLLAGIVILSSNKKPASIPQQSTPIIQPTSSAQSGNQISPTIARPAPPVFSGTQTINVTKQGFEPSVITVKAGTFVNWNNKSGQEAAVASDPHPTHQTYIPLNLGTFPDRNGVSLIFNTPGTYGYHNHLNPSQKGTVIVE